MKNGRWLRFGTTLPDTALIRLHKGDFMIGSRLRALSVMLLVCAVTASMQACGIASGLAVVPAASVAPVSPSASAVPRQTASPAKQSDTPEPTATLTSEPTPADSPTPTASPTPAPDPDAQYYSDRETVEIDADAGRWVYKSPVLSVEIKRVSTKKPVLNYYVAEVRTRDPGLLQPFYAGDDHSGRVRAVPEKIATKNKCVIAVTSDFFNNPYTSGTYRKGIIIRDGALKSDRKGADTLAVLPNGGFCIYKPNEISADKLLAMGVKFAYSFGPGLVRDGKIMPDLSRHALHRRNPRTGVGMVSPGHYIFIVVDGREPRRSVGVSLDDFAQMFIDYGCTAAYNFDGGQSASMCFMGRQLNVMHVQDDGFVQRRMPDLFGIGTSELASGK